MYDNFIFDLIRESCKNQIKLIRKLYKHGIILRVFQKTFLKLYIWTTSLIVLVLSKY